MIFYSNNCSLPRGCVVPTTLVLILSCSTVYDSCHFVTILNFIKHCFSNADYIVKPGFTGYGLTGFSGLTVQDVRSL